MTMLLSVDDVTTYYGQMRILEGISLQVGEGELVCLLGGNASGKSTTLKTILGYVKPSQGEVFLDGEEVSGLSTTEIVSRGISMAEVLRALEGPIAPMMCATDDPEHAIVCDRSARCTVNVLWVRVRDAVTGALDSMTLADLVPPRIPDVADPAAPIQPTASNGALTHL